MDSKQLGVVVIGQSPRPDIEEQLRKVIRSDVEIVMRGALDGMSRKEIAASPPTDGFDTLFTRLPPDLEPITVSKRLVEERASRQIARLVDESMTVTLFSCTGHFPHLEPRGLVVLPSLALLGLVNTILPRGRLGIMLPLAEQVEQLSRKWERPGLDVAGMALVPGASEAEIEAAGARMRTLRPDLVVMDCMAYDDAMRHRLRQAVGVPVILAVSAAARLVEELLA